MAGYMIVNTVRSMDLLLKGSSRRLFCVYFYFGLQCIPKRLRVWPFAVQLVESVVEYRKIVLEGPR